MTHDHTQSLSLPAICDLFNVEGLLPKLLEEEQLPTQIECGAVEKMTTPGLQLLLSMLLTANKLNTTVEFQGDRTVLDTAAQILGISLSHYPDQEQKA